jgi:hypothetical protein
LKSTEGKSVDKVTKDVTALDVTLPTVTDIQVTGKNTFVVNFSEPLKEAPALKVNDGNVSSVVSFTPGDSQLVVKAGSLNAGDNKVTVEGGKDYASLVVTKADKTFNYQAVTTAPSVSVKESTPYSVTLKFDRPVSNFTSASTLIRHTYNNSTNQVLGNSNSVTKISDSEYKVTFAAPFAPGATKLYLTYADGTADSDKVIDGFGNALQATSLDVTTSQDTVKPVVSDVTYDADHGKLVVKFSEDVDDASATGALARTNYIVRDSSNSVVTFVGNPSFATNSHNVVELNVGTLPADSYTVEVKNVQDKAVIKNTLDTVKKTVVVADTTKPVAQSAVNTTGSTVRVTFSKDINNADLTNAANYLFNTKALPAGTTLSKVDNKRVDITFPVSTVLTSGNITVSGAVKDTVGNAIGGFAQAPLDIKGNSDTAVKNADVKYVTAAAPNKVTFKVTQPLSGINKADIKVNNAVVSDATYVNNTDGTATVTLTTASIVFNTDGSGLDLNGIVISAGALTNSFGVANANLTMISSATDAMNAKISSVAASDADLNGGLDTVTVAMSEKVKASSVQESDFSVAGYVVTGVTSVNGAAVTLTLQESGLGDTNETPDVKLVGDIEDLNGNVGHDATNVVSVTAPTNTPLAITTLLNTGSVGTLVDGAHELGSGTLTKVGGVVTNGSASTPAKLTVKTASVQDLTQAEAALITGQAFVTYVKAPTGTVSADLYQDGAYSWTAGSADTQWLDASTEYVKVANTFAKLVNGKYVVSSDSTRTFKFVFKDANGKVLDSRTFTLDFSGIVIAAS